MNDCFYLCFTIHTTDGKRTSVMSNFFFSKISNVIENGCLRSIHIYTSNFHTEYFSQSSQWWPIHSRRVNRNEFTSNRIPFFDLNFKIWFVRLKNADEKWFWLQIIQEKYFPLSFAKHNFMSKIHKFNFPTCDVNVSLRVCVCVCGVDDAHAWRIVYVNQFKWERCECVRVWECLYSSSWYRKASNASNITYHKTERIIFFFVVASSCSLPCVTIYKCVNRSLYAYVSRVRVCVYLSINSWCQSK